MAITHFAFGLMGDQSSGDIIAAFRRETVSSEGIVPSGANTQTTKTAPRLGCRPVCRVASDTAVYVAFGENPNATNTENRFYIPAGGVDVFVCEMGDKGAVVTA